MNHSSLSGNRITIQNSRLQCQVGELLGSGGQGEVYRLEMGGKPLALKWYYPHAASPQQKAALEDLIRSGPPSLAFLWPLDLATLPASARFGYIMPLREPRFHNIVDLMKRRVEPSFGALLKVCRALAHNYLELHARGYCYRDISFGNVFFDAQNGEVLICDNDNVAVNGGKVSASVLGTPKFMAPEIVRGEAEPDIQTDLYSLSVLLFYLLMMHHPLDGERVLRVRCMDLPAMNRLYGSHPLFIFDPQDSSNAPHPQEQENPLLYWQIYPQFLRDLFTRAFTDGLRRPAERVRESEWRTAMQTLLDSVHFCPKCGMENFYDPQAEGDPPPQCWGCGSPLRPPLQIHIGRQIVCLNADTLLYPHHLDPQHIQDFSTPAAEVTRHPSQPALWGLKNLGKSAWTITAQDGSVKEVPPGRSFSLTPGTRVRFGEREGAILHPQK